MREKYEIQLNILNKNMISMGELIEKAIADAVISLVNLDTDIAKEVVAKDEKINEIQRVIESQCFKLLLCQQPVVASDLRTVSSALKMVTDMERIGDQSADIAEIILHIEEKNKEEFLVFIKAMSDVTIQMVNECISAYINKDLVMAQSVIEKDDKVDELFIKIRSELVKLIAKNPKKGEKATDYLMIAKYLERIGDHAVNIAEWVIYSITGKHVSDNC